MPVRNRSGSESAGHSSGGSLRLGAARAGAVAVRLEHLLLEARHPARSPPGRSGPSPRTVTSISPDTPVASCSSFTSLSAGRSCGTSSRTSEIDLGLGVGGPAEHGDAPGRSASTLPRPPASARSTAAQAAARRRAGRRGRRSGPAGSRRARAIRAGGRAQRAAACGGTLGGSGSRRQKSMSAAKPAVSAQASASDDADDEHDAEAAHHRHRRQQQHQEARPPSTAPAVAIVGPPARAARAPPPPAAAARPRERCSSKRAWNWIAVVHRQADQHRQGRDRGHRQRAAGQRQRAEDERRRGQRQRRAAAAACACGRPARSVRAITSSAAPSSTKIASCTGVGQAVDDDGHAADHVRARRARGLKLGSARRRWIRSIARARSASVRSGRSRTVISAPLQLGNR